MDKVKQNLIQHMETLCLKCGTRHSGSDGEHMAADYMVEYLSGLGLPVICEEFPSRGWKFESFELYNVTKASPVPGATACFFSGSADWEGKLLFICADQVNALSALDVAGQVCFIKHTGSVLDYNRIAEELEALGALAAIFISNRLAADTKVVRPPKLQRMGVATTDAYGTYFILDNPDDVYRLHIKAHSFDQISRNVVVRLGKGEKKGVIGGHYDTAPLIQGANDNASGTATVLELARLMKDAELDMTLDFVAFSGEEYMEDTHPMGSDAYVKKHRGEDIRWMLNIDGGGDSFSKRYMRIGLPEKLPQLKYNTSDVKYTCVGGDNAPFCEAGIPVVWPSNQGCLGILHTAFDSIEHMNYDMLTQHTEEALDLLQQLIAATSGASGK